MMAATLDTLPELFDTSISTPSLCDYFDSPEMETPLPNPEQDPDIIQKKKTSFKYRLEFSDESTPLEDISTPHPDYDKSTESSIDDLDLDNFPDIMTISAEEEQRIHDLIDKSSMFKPDDQMQLENDSESDSETITREELDQREKEAKRKEQKSIQKLKRIEEEFEEDDDEFFIPTQPLQVYEELIRKPKATIQKKKTNKKRAFVPRHKYRPSKPTMDSKFKSQLETCGIESLYDNEFIRNYLSEPCSDKSTCKICKVEGHSNYQMTACGSFVPDAKTAQITLLHGLDSFLICTSCFNHWVCAENAGGILEKRGAFGRSFVKKPLSNLSLFFGANNTKYAKHVSVNIFNKKQ